MKVPSSFRSSAIRVPIPSVSPTFTAVKIAVRRRTCQNWPSLSVVVKLSNPAEVPLWAINWKSP